MTEEPARFAGVDLPAPDFAGDDGRVDPALSGVLAAYADAAASRHDVLAVLAGTRLLVPVVAVLDEVETGADGLAREKDSHMATVTMLSPDGRRGLLAFTCSAALTAWQAGARPVPATARRVAQAALQECSDAVLLDVAGPVPFPVDGPALTALAEGRAWLPPELDPVLATVVAATLRATPHLLAYQLGSGRAHGTDLLVTVTASPAAAGEQVAREVAARLGVAELTEHCPAGIGVVLG